MMKVGKSSGYIRFGTILERKRCFYGVTILITIQLLLPNLISGKTNSTWKLRDTTGGGSSIFKSSTAGKEQGTIDGIKDLFESSCEEALGMESGKIPTGRISASSSFDVKSTGPQNARIRTELVGGAWCPKSTIQEGVKEYLEIDFDGEYRITKTETQGRFGNGMGQEFAKHFRLEYWRDGINRWNEYKDLTGKSILDGNANTYIGVEQKLRPPILASKIRFIPHSIHPTTICMRVEAYGCPYIDGIIHYECPQGYWKGNPEIDFRDGTYDGWIDEDEILRGGIGLLTDGIIGPTDFQFKWKEQGNQWLGWDSEYQPVKIGFQFDRIRKFQSVSIHVNNLVSQGVEVFSSVEIYMSVDGTRFSEFPLRWTTSKKEIEKDKAILLTIPLKNRLGTLIRLELYHSNHWLLLSEITFNSEPYTGNVTEDILSLNYLQDGPNDPQEETNTQNVSSNDGDHDENSKVRHELGILSLVIGSIGLFILCSLLLVSCFLLKKSRGKLVGDMSIGLRAKTLVGDDQHLSDVVGSEFQIVNCKSTSDVKSFLWNGLMNATSNGGGSDEGFYNELIYRDGATSSSSNSVISSNARLTTATNKNSASSKYQQKPTFTDYLNGIDGNIRYFNGSSSSQPSTPKTERHFGTASSSIIPPPPPKIFATNRPIAQPHYTFAKNKAGSGISSIFTTNSPSSASTSGLNTTGYHFTSNSPKNIQLIDGNKRGIERCSTNYYAATDIFRRPLPLITTEASSQNHFHQNPPQQKQRF